MEKVVKKYGELGYIIIKGKSKKEDSDELDIWRKKLVGKSKYVIEGEKSGRKHRKLKVEFTPTKIFYISINNKNIKSLRIFNQGRNSDGKPRRPKYILPKKLLKDFVKSELNLEKTKPKAL